MQGRLQSAEHKVGKHCCAMFVCMVAYCQKRVLLLPVMLAHCLTFGVEIGWDEGYGTYLPVNELTFYIYSWVQAYCDKLKQDMLALGVWDPFCFLCTSLLSRYVY